MAARTKSSPWVWIAIGCVGAVVVVILLVAGLGFMGYRQIKQFESEMEDPAQRAARVKEVLGYEELPPGYYPLVGFSVPFLMEVGLLSDRPPVAGDPDEQGFDERGFIYLKMLSFGDQQQELEDVFEGRADDAEALRNSSIRLDQGDTIGRGAFELEGDVTVRYVTQRGDVTFQGMNGDGLTTLTLVECPGERRMRMGIWFGPDPDPEAPVEELDLAGTPADESEIEAFMSLFDLCR